jgi:hypothetical protein
MAGFGCPPRASDGRILKPGDREFENYRRLVEATVTFNMDKLQKTRLENHLKLIIGRAAELDGIATWRSHTVEKLNYKAFETEAPELYAEGGSRGS